MNLPKIKTTLILDIIVLR